MAYLLPLQVHISLIVKDPANEFTIEDTGDITLPTVHHEVAGEGVAGIVMIPSARGKKLSIASESDFVKLAETGTF